MAVTTTSGALRKPRGQGGERREEILAHAQWLFLRDGVQHVSTRQIAHAVGVSQPTLYAYFPTKLDLLQEVCERAFAQLEATAEAAREEGGDSLERLIRGYIEFGLQNPEAYRIAFMLEFPVDEKVEAAMTARKPGVQAFDQLRRLYADRIGAEHPDLEVASQSLWAAMHGLVSLLLARDGFPWVDRAELIDWHVAALMKGAPEPRP